MMLCPRFELIFHILKLFNHLKHSSANHRCSPGLMNNFCRFLILRPEILKMKRKCLLTFLHYKRGQNNREMVQAGKTAMRYTSIWINLTPVGSSNSPIQSFINKMRIMYPFFNVNKHPLNLMDSALMADKKLLS